jgi:hypothetical protein
METTSDALTLRHYRGDDYPMLLEWWEQHEAPAMHESMVPESTCVVLLNGEPAACGSIFPCNNNHVAFFHGMVTRPGLNMREAKAVISALQDGIDIMMRSSGHTLLLGTVPDGAMMRGARMMGFTVQGTTPVYHVARLTRTPQSHGS